MRAGLLNRFVGFYRNESVRDGFGSTKSEWVEVCRVRGAVRYEDMRLGVTNDELDMRDTVRVWIRRREDIPEYGRMLLDGTWYTIVSLRSYVIRREMEVVGERVNV